MDTLRARSLRLFLSLGAGPEAQRDVGLAREAQRDVGLALEAQRDVGLAWVTQHNWDSTSERTSEVFALSCATSGVTRLPAGNRDLCYITQS